MGLSCSLLRPQSPRLLLVDARTFLLHGNSEWLNWTKRVKSALERGLNDLTTHRLEQMNVSVSPAPWFALGRRPLVLQVVSLAAVRKLVFRTIFDGPMEAVYRRETPLVLFLHHIRVAGPPALLSTFKAWLWVARPAALRMRMSEGISSGRLRMSADISGRLVCYIHVVR